MRLGGDYITTKDSGSFGASPDYEEEEDERECEFSSESYYISEAEGICPY